MRGLRAALVTVPPLLADLIRHVLVNRAELLIVAELTDVESALERLRELAPDVVIIGQSDDRPSLDVALVRTDLPGACVLVLSADLKQLFGPGADDVAIFSPDTLTSCLPRQS